MTGFVSCLKFISMYVNFTKTNVKLMFNTDASDTQRSVGVFGSEVWMFSLSVRPLGALKEMKCRLLGHCYLNYRCEQLFVFMNWSKVIAQFQISSQVKLTSEISNSFQFQFSSSSKYKIQIHYHIYLFMSMFPAYLTLGSAVLFHITATSSLAYVRLAVLISS